MKDGIVYGSCATVSTICGITQTSEVFQLIQVILGVIASLFAIAYTIWKWYKKAKKDGKIEQNEVDELFDDLHDILMKEEEDEDDRN